MKVRQYINKVVFKNIANEAQLEGIRHARDKSGAVTESRDFGTTVIVTGSTEKMVKFAQEYNSFVG